MRRLGCLDTFEPYVLHRISKRATPSARWVGGVARYCGLAPACDLIDLIAFDSLVEVLAIHFTISRPQLFPSQSSLSVEDVLPRR